MCVGHGVTIEEVGLSDRTPKPWYSKVFYPQLEKLKEILVEKYAQKAQFAILVEPDNYKAFDADLVMELLMKLGQ